ncbi:hypothetical protein Tco_0893237 [Tanacetum coccineum]|uniref:Uncharacterized protein n=1 Tax=Tanacetum coccineum TaxID=301880 RepID=A0ABQ5C8Q4_9ASTR
MFAIHENTDLIRESKSILTFVGDDDNYLFTMLGSSSPASWQGSNTQIVVRTIVGIWYRFDIRIPEPYLSLFENDHCLTSQQFAIHYSADCMWNCDDDKYLFTMLGSLSLASWQGSHTQIVVATMEGIWTDTKKRTKNKAKTTKPDSEWKRL